MMFVVTFTNFEKLIQLHNIIQYTIIALYMQITHHFCDGYKEHVQYSNVVHNILRTNARYMDLKIMMQTMLN